jgi:tetratricopeptide (TPR) repeat protein
VTLAELARHWIAATRPADIDKAIDYARRAGDAARDALAPEDANRWYQQALDLIDRQPTPDQHRQAALLFALGTEQRQAGRPEYRETLTQGAALAQQLGDTEILVRAALVFNRTGIGNQIGDDDAKAILRTALDRIGPEATTTRAQLLAEFSNVHDAGSEWQARRDLAREAVDMARRTNDDATFVEVFINNHITLETPDQRDEFVADVQSAVTMADRIGDPALRARIRLVMMVVCYMRADVAAADAVLAEIQALADEVGLPYLRYHAAQFTSGRLLLAGHAGDAETANERSLEAGMAAAIPQSLAAYGGLLHAIRQHQGRLDEIAALLFDAARDNPSIAALRSVVPGVLCELGRTDEAHERLVVEAAAGFDFPYDGLWIASMTSLTDAAATTGDQASARALLAALEPFATLVISAAATAVGAVARPLARAATALGDYDRAEKWFATAHDIHARLQAPYWTARGQLDHADLYIARNADGDLARARKLATTAAATAAEYGCGGLTKRADLLLADH